MQIVIDIPDAAYNAIRACKNLPSDTPADDPVRIVMSAVADGTPISGAGRGW